jgi:trehalose-6-phosphatase
MNIAINIVTLHGDNYAYEMIKALSNEDVKIYVVISDKMIEIDKWKRIQNITLIEVNGFTRKLDFVKNFFKLLFLDKKKNV